jgi:hypothetical protein
VITVGISATANSNAHNQNTVSRTGEARIHARIGRTMKLRTISDPTPACPPLTARPDVPIAVRLATTGTPSGRVVGRGSAESCAGIAYLDAGTMMIDQQWSANGQRFKGPKHDSYRKLPLVPMVADLLRELPRESEFVFTKLCGTHYTLKSLIPREFEASLWEVQRV